MLSSPVAIIPVNYHSYHLRFGCKMKLNFEQGKSREDYNSGKKGEGQLILAMMTAFVRSGENYKIYGIVLNPVEVS